MTYTRDQIVGDWPGTTIVPPTRTPLDVIAEARADARRIADVCESHPDAQIDTRAAIGVLARTVEAIAAASLGHVT